MNQNQKIDQKIDQTAWASAYSFVQNTNFQQLFSDFYTNQEKYCKEIGGDLYLWADDHAIELLCSALLASYSYIAYQMYAANQIIFDQLAWSNWQGDKKLEELFAIPQATLESELLFAFQHSYIDQQHPTDFMYSLVQSSISLNYEIAIVKLQIDRYQWIAACQCSRFFFINADSIAILQDKYKKLLFMKYIFASWCAHYKIEQHKNK